MNICEAIAQMRAGRFVARPNWPHRLYLFIDGDGDVIMFSRNGFDSPWQAPHPDIMADDWTEVIPHP